MEFLSDYDGFAYELLNEIQLEELENACRCNRRYGDCLKNIMDVLEDTEYSGSCSEYDIACCIEMTYPNGAKKIVEIFRNHIQPVLRELSGYNAKEA